MCTFLISNTNHECMSCISMNFNKENLAYLINAEKNHV